MLALYKRGEQGGQHKVEFFRTYEQLTVRLLELRWPAFTVSTIKGEAFHPEHTWRGIRFSNEGYAALQHGFVPDLLLSEQEFPTLGEEERHHIQIKVGTRLVTKFSYFHRPSFDNFPDLPKQEPLNLERP